jgi:hypothetical protein
VKGWRSVEELTPPLNRWVGVDAVIVSTDNEIT